MAKLLVPCDKDRTCGLFGSAAALATAYILVKTIAIGKLGIDRGAQATVHHVIQCNGIKIVVDQGLRTNPQG